MSYAVSNFFQGVHRNQFFTCDCHLLLFQKSASIKGDDDLGDMLAQLHQDKGTKVLATSAKTSKQPLKYVPN